MQKLRDGMYSIGTIVDGDIESLIIVNMNKGTVVFNNANRGNAGTWAEFLSIKDIISSNGKYEKEEWYKLYKKFIKDVDKTEYNTMITKINIGLI